MTFQPAAKERFLFAFAAWRRDYLTLGVVLPVLLIGAFLGFLLWEVAIPYVRDHTAFYGAPYGVVARDPVKTPAKAEPFLFKGTHGLYTHKHEYVIAPVFDYEIEARVLHTRHYYSDPNAADLIPFDMGLGWGLMSDAAALRKYFVFHHGNNGGRYLWADLRGDWQKVPPSYLEEIQAGRYYSNNHLIPASEEVFEALQEMGAGDLVRLKGYLVNVTRPDEPRWYWKTSSYAREDAGKYSRWGNGDSADHMTTCDTIFVTSAAKIVPKE